MGVSVFHSGQPELSASQAVVPNDIRLFIWGCTHADLVALLHGIVGRVMSGTEVKGSGAEGCAARADIATVSGVRCEQEPAPKPIGHPGHR